jgi:hypothetical protein
LSAAHRIGGLTTIATHGADFIAARARAGQEAALNQKLLAELAERVPDFEFLPEAERLKRLDFLRRAHYARLANASAKVRARKAGPDA